jgi:hypothetical protein
MDDELELLPDDEPLDLLPDAPRSETAPLTPPARDTSYLNEMKAREQGPGEAMLRTLGSAVGGELPYPLGWNQDPEKTEDAKTQWPAGTATADTIGQILPWLVPEVKGAGLTGKLAKAALTGGAQGAYANRKGDAGDIALGAVEGAGTGALLRGLGGVEGATVPRIAARAVPTAFGVGTGATQAYQGLASGDTFDAVQGAENLLAPGLLHAASKGSRKAAGLEPQRQAALGDLRAAEQERIQKVGQKQAGEMAAAEKDVDSQRAKTASQNVARTGAAEAAEKADITDARNTERLALQERIDTRATTDDAQMRTHKTAAEAKRTADKAASDAHRLAGLDFADDYAKRMGEYEKADAAYRDYQQQAKARGEDVAVRASRIKAVNAAEQSLREAHVKEGEDLRAAIEALKAKREGNTESARAYFANLHGELYDRATRHITGAQALGQEPNSDIVGSLRYLASKHESLSPERFAKLDDYASDPDAAVAAEAGRRNSATDAEMQSLSDRLNAPTQTDPDFRAVAEKQIDAKAAAKAKAEADARAAAEAEVAPLGPAPTAPVKPDRSGHDQAMRDFVRQKIAAGKTPLPPKPDALATRGINRAERAALRDAPGFDPSQSRARSDPGLIQDARAPIEAGDSTPDQRKAALDREILKRLAEGRQIVKTDLDTARANGVGVAKTPGKQFAREKSSGAVAKAAKTVGGAAGGAVFGSLLGPLGAAAGAAGGGGAAYKMAGGEKVNAVMKHLARTIGENERTGERTSRFATPAEAQAVYEDAQRHYNKGSMSLDRARSGKVGAGVHGAAALTPAMAAAIAAWLKEKDDEPRPVEMTR